MAEIGDSLFQRFVVLTGSCVQVEVIGVVNYAFLHWENIRPQFELSAEGSQEVFERELRLSHRESDCRVCTDVLIAVMEVNSDKALAYKFLKVSRVNVTDEKDVFVIEFAGRFLRHF